MTTYTWTASGLTPSGSPGSGDTVFVPAGQTVTTTGTSPETITGITLQAGGPATTVTLAQVTLTSATATFASGDTLNVTGGTPVVTGGSIGNGTTVTTGSTLSSDTLNFGTNDTLNLTDTAVNGSTLAFQSGDTLNLTGSMAGAMAIDLNDNGGPSAKSTISLTGSAANLAINATGTVIDQAMTWLLSPGGTTTLTVQQNGTSSGLLVLGGALVEAGGTLVVNGGTNTDLVNSTFLMADGDSAPALVQLNAIVDAFAGATNILGGAHGATLEVNTALSGGQAIVFDDANGTLRIDATNTLAAKNNTPVLANFKAHVEGFASGDTIDLAGLTPSGSGLSWSYGSDTLYGPGVLELFNNGTLIGLLRLSGANFVASSGTLTSNGTQAASGNFVFASDGAGGTAITVQSSGSNTGSNARWLDSSGDWNTGSLWSGGVVPGSSQVAEIAMGTAEAAAALGGSFTPDAITVTSSASAGSLLLADPLATLTVSAPLTLAGSLQQIDSKLKIASGGAVQATRYLQSYGGDLTLDAGGTVALSGARAFASGTGLQGFDANGYNTIAGSIASQGAISVGQNAPAWLGLQAGGTVSDSYAIVGGGPFASVDNSQSYLQITGPGASWTDAGGDSSTPYSGAMLVGGGAGGVGNTLSGTTFPTTIKNGGTGNLSVDQGATLTDASYAVIGVAPGASGNAQVSNGALWLINPGSTATPGTISIGSSTIYSTGTGGVPLLTVGMQGTGQLNITNNGSVGNGGTVRLGGIEQPNSFKMVIGQGSGASGMVNVNGPNSLLDTGGGPLAIGHRGMGMLSVNNGGTVLVGNGGTTTGIPFGVVLGNKNTNVSGTLVSSMGTLQVGSSSTLTSLFNVQSGDMVIGRDGYGAAFINNYGSLSLATGTLYLGGVNASSPGAGPGGRLFVNGGTVTAAGLASVAQGGNSRLSVSGGTINLGSALNLENGTGSINNGVVSLWNGGTASIGGGASLAVNSGGVLQFGSSNLLGCLTVGDATGSGTLQVSGGTVADPGGLLLGMVAAAGTQLPVPGATPPPTTPGYAGTLQLSSSALVQAAGIGIAPTSSVSVDASSTLELGSTGFSGVAPGVLALGSNGLLAGAGTVSASSIVNNGLIAAYASGNALQLSGAISGSGTLAIDAGATLNVGAVGSGENLVFGSGTAEVLQLTTPAAMGALITGFSPGDTIDLTTIPATGLTATWSQTGASGSLSLMQGGTVLASLSLAGTYTQSDFSLTTDGSGGTDLLTSAAPCFAAGTRLATPGGAVAVERLAEGDTVCLAGGGTARVVWLGHRTVACARHPRPQDVLPVRVAAHAFGPGRPHTDLRLSPDHAVFLDGVLIPIRYLLNGASIVQEPAGEVTYWHVELDHHDVLLAEGLACESYLDTGNRGAFANGGGAVMMHPDFALRVWERESCARLVLAGAELEAARSFVLEQARALGFAVTREPELHLRVGGVSLWPHAVADGVYRFTLPGDATEAVIASRAAIAGELDDGYADGRRLGVMLERIVFRQGGEECEIPLAALPAGVGFHAFESEGGRCWRWTDGHATLEVPAGFRPDRPLELELGVVAAQPTWVAPSARGAARAAA
jgi:T5SS/PEP-CTERM-associated repeat protein